MQNWASKASTVPNLHAGATTSVAQIGSINVVLSLWIEKRQTVKAKAGKSFVTSVVSASNDRFARLGSLHQQIV